MMGRNMRSPCGAFMANSNFPSARLMRRIACRSQACPPNKSAAFCCKPQKASASPPRNLYPPMRSLLSGGGQVTCSGVSEHCYLETALLCVDHGGSRRMMRIHASRSNITTPTCTPAWRAAIGPPKPLSNASTVCLVKLEAHLVRKDTTVGVASCRGRSETRRKRHFSPALNTDGCVPATIIGAVASATRTALYVSH